MAYRSAAIDYADFAESFSLGAGVPFSARADMAIRQLFADPQIAYTDAHRAAPGCFLAHVTRDAELVR